MHPSSALIWVRSHTTPCYSRLPPHTVQHQIKPHSTTPPHPPPHHTTPHHTTPHHTITITTPHSTTQHTAHSTTQHNTLQRSTPYCNTTRHDTTQCNAMQHDITQYHRAHQSGIEGIEQNRAQHSTPSILTSRITGTTGTFSTLVFAQTAAIKSVRWSCALPIF